MYLCIWKQPWHLWIQRRKKWTPSAQSRCLVPGDLTWCLRFGEGVGILLLEPSIIVIEKLYQSFIGGREIHLCGLVAWEYVKGLLEGTCTVSRALGASWPDTSQHVLSCSHETKNSGHVWPNEAGSEWDLPAYLDVTELHSWLPWRYTTLHANAIIAKTDTCRWRKQWSDRTMRHLANSVWEANERERLGGVCASILSMKMIEPLLCTQSFGVQSKDLCTCGARTVAGKGWNVKGMVKGCR